jgi:hypothetical protein
MGISIASLYNAKIDDEENEVKSSYSSNSNSILEGLNLDIQSQEFVASSNIKLSEEILETLQGALAAGVAVNGVLSARRFARLKNGE